MWLGEVHLLLPATAMCVCVCVCVFVCVSVSVSVSVQVNGGGNHTRSFMYISDLVEGLVRLMNGNYSQPVNLVRGGGREGEGGRQGRIKKWEGSGGRGGGRKDRYGMLSGLSHSNFLGI